MILYQLQPIQTMSIYKKDIKFQKNLGFDLESRMRIDEKSLAQGTIKYTTQIRIFLHFRSKQTRNSWSLMNEIHLITFCQLLLTFILSKTNLGRLSTKKMNKRNLSPRLLTKGIISSTSFPNQQKKPWEEYQFQTKKFQALAHIKLKDNSKEMRKKRI